MTQHLPEITRLQLQRGRRQRVNIYLDEEYAFSLQLDLAASLQRGQRLSAAEVEALKAEDAYRAALDRALAFLEHRPRSRREVQDKLIGEDCDPIPVERVLERLEALALVDDARFAEWWVSNRLQHRPRGERALRHELRQRGIDEAVAQAAVQGLDEHELARRVALEQAERYRGHDRQRFDRRLGSWLQRRGFGWEAVRGALDHAWRQVETSDPGDASTQG
ncbi:MAG: RecX family transcriptional regulator [Caldilineae bacterium]|nr:RecX family transcriptional regulator [Chloroflexota bacterium]MCB9176368.1 RecX family transcriptional regulator [Caldilineae bacterium]